MDIYTFSQQIIKPKQHAIVQRRYNPITRETGYALIYVSSRKTYVTHLRKELQKDGHYFVDTPFNIPKDTLFE